MVCLGFIIPVYLNYPYLPHPSHDQVRESGKQATWVLSHSFLYRSSHPDGISRPVSGGISPPQPRDVICHFHVHGKYQLWWKSVLSDVGSITEA
ncbi:hypothetical protein AVEN_180085-1 [Araneus ventricosus]|uniref:Uncharacterized protein n=1 Tax=Araneus ventricosus TaxID=182803 RepID=A0A4Y2NAS1_ARAVE|nr:hypothetical protein AVEN_180085-1 [Araneus ventricosus]